MDPNAEHSRCLAKDVFAVTSVFNGRIVIHIRRYTQYVDGGLFYPTRDGVAMTKYEWEQWRNVSSRVIANVANGADGFSFHISPNFKMSIRCSIAHASTTLMMTKSYSEKKSSIILDMDHWMGFLKAQDDIARDLEELLSADNDLKLRELIAEERDRLSCNPDDFKSERNDELTAILLQVLRRELVHLLTRNLPSIIENEDKDRFVTLHFNRCVNELSLQDLSYSYVQHVKSVGLFPNLSNNFLKTILLTDLVSKIKEDLTLTNDWFCTPLSA